MGCPQQSEQAPSGQNDRSYGDVDESHRSNNPGQRDAPDGRHVPPPHLAARLYSNRVNNARRKSSATSSRRNSLTSVHSHASSLSYRRTVAAGCHRNYIAQHLRRASIIESRKARLADRAAHVEQVRLRAALVKSAPRGSVSASEERALAAQLAKEKYLAKVAATCAEEVARAKRVAEEVKERKLAEEARARHEMEERHLEAERRRAEYQRNLQARRAHRADSAEKKLAVLDEEGGADEAASKDKTRIVKKVTLTHDEAARRIQHAWKLHVRASCVGRFMDLDLHAKARTMNFDEMTSFVADPHTIQVTTAFLTQLGLQAADDANAALSTRTFLSAFMILAHPSTVLNNKNGAQEQDLISKTTELVERFISSTHRLASWNNYSLASTQLEQLSQTYSAFTSAFAAWRLQDSSVLIEGMVASFVELDAIWQTVKDDTRGEVASDYRQGIRDNQVMLLSRIRKLAGPERADALIKRAIREGRRRRPKRRPAAEIKPRGIEASRAEVTSDTSDDSAEAVAERLGISEHTAPPVVHSSDVAKLFTPMPSNRVLAHELALDREYRLEDSGPMSELRTQLYRSICESMKRGFEAGEGALWTLSAAENVREKLLRMLKPGNSMHRLISEALDLEHIRRQTEHAVFSYDGFFDFMATILPKLCAPFRDEEVKKLAEELRSGNDELAAMIEKLFKVLRTVDLLSLDYTNFMIMNAAPTLIREAPGYEERMFARDLESGEVTLERTKAWWRSSYEHLRAEADRRDPEGLRRMEDGPSRHKVYAHALVGVAVEQGELLSDTLPETLALDFQRLQSIRVKAVRVTVIGAILLTAKNLLKRDSRSLWKGESARLWQLLAGERYDNDGTGQEDGVLATSQKALAVLETGHNMPNATKQQLAGTISRFFAQAAGLSSAPAARFTDPVLKVLFARLRAHIGARMAAATSAERVRAASGASETLASFGLAESVGQVGAMVETLEKVRDADWAAHGRWLTSVAEEVEGATGGGG